MSGGEISGNPADNGGGVYMYGNGTSFTIWGGVIYGNEPANGDKSNTASTIGAAFYKQSSSVSAQWNANKDGTTLVDLDTIDTTLDLRP
jgi:hypothetical protein